MKQPNKNDYFIDVDGTKILPYAKAYRAYKEYADDLEDYVKHLSQSKDNGGLGLTVSGEFRETYKANIVMAFKDEVERSGAHSPNPENHSILMTREMLHKIANKSADDFLDLWCK